MTSFDMRGIPHDHKIRGLNASAVSLRHGLHVPDFSDELLVRLSSRHQRTTECPVLVFRIISGEVQWFVRHV